MFRALLTSGSNNFILVSNSSCFRSSVLAFRSLPPFSSCPTPLLFSFAQTLAPSLPSRFPSRMSVFAQLISPSHGPKFSQRDSSLTPSFTINYSDRNASAYEQGIFSAIVLILRRPDATRSILALNLLQCMAQHWLECDVTAMMVIIVAPRGTKRDTVDVKGGVFSDVSGCTIRSQPYTVQVGEEITRWNWYSDSMRQWAEELAP